MKYPDSQTKPCSFLVYMQKCCWTRCNGNICLQTRLSLRGGHLPSSVGAGVFDPVVVDKGRSRHDPMMQYNEKPSALDFVKSSSELQDSPADSFRSP